MTAGLGRTLTYTSYNMPAQVVGVGYSGGASTTYNYVYNAEHERTKLVHSTLGTFIYLHPAGKGQLLYEKQTEASPSTRIEHKYYISAGGTSVAVHYARENPNLTETTTATRYLHQDHLGSITLITNEAGGVTERLAYEAYGKRRYLAGTDDPTNGLFGQVTDRGFTSHEHLDEIALIHMNGRVYDPVLGRFVTADPFLQDPGNLQSYNRYSYVLNNPLMYVDPSGYFSLKKIFKVVAIAAVAWYTGQLISNAMISSATSGFVAGTNGLSTALVTLGGEAGALTAFGTAVNGAAAGFTGGFLASGGDFGFALKSGIAVGLTAGLGHFGAEFAGTPGSVAARSLGSGISTKAFGGDFADGIKNGLLGALRSEAYAYMQTQTDKLATAWWRSQGKKINYDEFGRPWTYGNRGCADGSGSICATWFPERALMSTEDISFGEGLFTSKPLVGGGVGETRFLGALLNSVSKVHDWMNQMLTGVYDANPISATYGGALPGSALRGTVIDAISTAGMIPAAAFTARALYNNPLRVKSK